MSEPVYPAQLPAKPPMAPIPIETQKVDAVLLAAQGWQEIVPGSFMIGEFHFIPGLSAQAEEYAFRFVDQTQGLCSGRISALLAVRVRA